MKKISFLLAALVLVPSLSFAAQPPALPRLQVATSYPATSRSVTVHAGDNLQQALDQAAPGDELVLDAGATFPGPIHLPAKNGSGWIVIRSSRSSDLPPGSRVSPAQTVSMAKITAPGKNIPALTVDSNARRYRLVGLEIAAKPGDPLVSLADIGDYRSTNASAAPSEIVLDRMYLHGDTSTNLRRCLTLQSAATAVLDSYLSDCHEKGADSQAIAGWNGPGPYLIQNNYLEGAGENLLFGGATPMIPDLVPSDITIRGNYFRKPSDWKGRWTAKNLLELKTGRRVLIEDNLFENSWTDGQTGIGILFKSANQGGCGWCMTEDVTFQNNIVRNVEEALTMNAHERSSASDQEPPAARNILVRNNLFENVARRLFYVNGGVANATFDRNTANTGTTILLGSDADVSNPNFAFLNNLIRRKDYGIGTGANEGIPTLQAKFSPFEFSGNVLLNASGDADENIRKRYPSGTSVGPSNTSNAGADPSALESIRTRVAGGTGPAAPVSPAPTPASPSPSPANAPDTSALQGQIRGLLAQIDSLRGQLGNKTAAPNTIQGNLRFGLTNNANVVFLQQKLTALGYYSGPQNGNFYGLTLGAVKNFQAKNGLPATGFVGPLTRASLNQR